MITLIPYEKSEILDGISDMPDFKSIPDIVEYIFEIDKKKIYKDLQSCLTRFRDDIFVVLEHPYVEKYYRDTYYNFFSKKHKLHERDSFRISFFLKSVLSDEKKIENISFDDFSEPSKFGYIQKAYLGFMTIRPTSHRIIGHTFISPQLLKEEHRSFVCCLCKKKVFISGIELKVYGFPFCAQDNESITCAQSVLINLLDYFSNKFPEYQSLLPSQINNILEKQQEQRQLPASGLVNSEISFVLKELGFGTVIYSKDNIAFENSFKEILYMYIESGIPVILHLENETKKEYHAVLAIGREDIADKVELKKTCFLKKKEKHVDFPHLFSKILVMNDNWTPYELVDFENPAEGYTINSFIVPLYSKVHTEAFKGRKYLTQIVQDMQNDKKTRTCILIDNAEDYLIRMFLATNRSFKNHVAKMANAHPDLRILVTEKSMPKFIWVAEIIKGHSVDENQAVESVILLDATGTGESGRLIAAFNTEHLIFKDVLGIEQYDSDIDENLEDIDYRKNKYSIKDLDSESFVTFANNLKGKHTLWRS